MAKVPGAPVPRSKNFTDREVDLLIDLVTTKKDVIENKETDGSSNAEKMHAWEYITRTFNLSTNSTPRTEKQLKSKWDNLKKDSRTYHGEHRKQKYITGGGKRQVPTKDSYEKVLSIIGSSGTGFDNPYDNDSINKKMKRNDEATEITQNVQSKEADDCDVFEYLTKESRDIALWKEWSKIEGKKKISPPLKNSINKVSLLHCTEEKKINPDKSFQIIKTFTPLDQLNLGDKRITERRLEQLQSSLTSGIELQLDDDTAVESTSTISTATNKPGTILTTIKSGSIPTARPATDTIATKTASILTSRIGTTATDTIATKTVSILTSRTGTTATATKTASIATARTGTTATATKTGSITTTTTTIKPGSIATARAATETIATSTITATTTPEITTEPELIIPNEIINPEPLDMSIPRTVNNFMTPSAHDLITGAGDSSDEIPSNSRSVQNLKLIETINKFQPTTSSQDKPGSTEAQDKVHKLIDLMIMEMEQKVPLEVSIMKEKLQKEKLQCQLLKMLLTKK